VFRIVEDEVMETEEVAETAEQKVNTHNSIYKQHLYICIQMFYDIKGHHITSYTVRTQNHRRSK
jgi:hypothetical protein